MKALRTSVLNINFLISFIILLEIAISLGVNAESFHYQTGSNLVTKNLLLSLPGVILLFIAGCVIELEAPRISYFFKALGQFYGVALLIQVLSTVIQLTPFSPIDQALWRFDQFFHFDSGHFYLWTLRHVFLEKTLFWAYIALPFELMYLPLLLIILQQKKAVSEFFSLCLITGCIGFTFYYFFPSTAPASVEPTVHFAPVYYDFLRQFNEIHRHEPLQVFIGGVVGMPSFHVIWALLLMLICRPFRGLFWLSVLFNGWVILSTLALGWHFLADVIGAFLVVGVSVWVLQK